ncbi:MAG: hypothetical protein ABSE63_11225 [Thermoguttaceae bacterium]|jgi:hypothetical protein
MKKHLHLDEQTWEALESCPLGDCDLADPAMAHLTAEMAANPQLQKILDRIEHLDGKIAAAFQDVSIPPGLIQRVLHRLSHARLGIPAIYQSNAKPDRPININDVEKAASSPSQGKRKVSRRRLLVAGGLLSAAGMLFIALWLNFHNVESYTEQTVIDEAIRFFEADNTDGQTTLAEKSPPKAYPFSRAVIFSQGVCRREIRDFLGRAGTAYDLPGRNGRRATLYVIKQSAQGLGNEPQFRPFTTGGLSASAWQEGGLLYVLVVQGEPNTYQNYLNLPRGPVA